MSEDLDKRKFLVELESIIEDDEAYGSNILILNYAFKNGVIAGKFRDSWNSRVYEFEINENAISYKPAINLDSANLDSELVRQFDLYSDGYNSLFDRQDGKLTGKRVKKPKCGNTAYGCGFSCIGLKKTCRILGRAGKKAGTNQGSAIGKERLSKLILLVQKLYIAGDKTAATSASAIASNINKAREKRTAAGTARRLDRPKERDLKSVEEAAQKTREARLNTRKAANTQPKTASDPTTNPKTHSIKTESEFRKIISHVLPKINDEGNHDGLVPIHKVRELIGELIPRDKFKEFMLEAQADDAITLIGGAEFTDFTTEQRANSLDPLGNGHARQYIRFAPENLDKLSAKEREKIDKTLKNRPDLDPLGTARQYTNGAKITSQKEFEETTEKVRKSLDEDFIYDNLVPISRIREVLQNRVSETDFDNMIKKAQENDFYRLIGGGREISKDIEKGAVKTALGSSRHYISK